NASEVFVELAELSIAWIIKPCPQIIHQESRIELFAAEKLARFRTAPQRTQGVPIAIIMELACHIRDIFDQLPRASMSIGEQPTRISWSNSTLAKQVSAKNVALRGNST